MTITRGGPLSNQTFIFSSAFTFMLVTVFLCLCHYLRLFLCIAIDSTIEISILQWSVTSLCFYTIILFYFISTVQENNAITCANIEASPGAGRLTFYIHRSWRNSSLASTQRTQYGNRKKYYWKFNDNKTYLIFDRQIFVLMCGRHMFLLI